MATEQAFYALVSYKRLINKQTSLYDMTDVFENPSVPYDVNFDGKADINDVTLIQKYIAESAEFDSVQINIADCDKDGKITIDDVTLIQKYIADFV